MRRSHALLIALVAGVILLAGCRPGEVRTFLADPNPRTGGLPDNTDTSGRWNSTSLREAYVCPRCGWSYPLDRDPYSALPVRCPDYWGQHGGLPGALNPGVAPLATSEQRRVLDTVEWVSATPDADRLARCDVHYQDAAGNHHYLAIVGRPYHPARVWFKPGDNPSGANYRGSRVFSEVRGLTDYRDTDMFGMGAPDQLPGFPKPNRRPGVDDRVRFLYMPPGVTEPRAYAFHDTRMDDPAGQAGDNGPDTTDVYGDPAGQRWIDPLNNGFYVAVNPHRVSSDDRYWVRYSVNGNDPTNPGQNLWRIEMYSRMNGLEFDTGVRTGWPAVNPVYFVTYSGALRVATMLRADPDAANTTPVSWVFSFRIASNCRIVPGGADGVKPTFLDPSTSANFATLTWPGWRLDGPYFPLNTDTAAPVYGRVDDSMNVFRVDPTTGTQVDLGRQTRYPFVIEPGQVGVGRVEVQWAQNLAQPAGTEDRPPLAGSGTATDGFRAGDPTDRNGPWYEWWYDGNWGGSSYVIAGGGSRSLSGWAPMSGVDSRLWTPPKPYDAIVSRFVSSPIRVGPSNEADRHGPVEPNYATQTDLAYPRILADRMVGGQRNGAARPGEVTERRIFTVQTRGMHAGSILKVDGAARTQGGATTDETAEANDSTADDMTLWANNPHVDDAYYIGGAAPFCGVIINISRVAVGADMTVVWEYSTGAGWSALRVWEDTTNGLQPTLRGRRIVRFDKPANWASATVSGMTNYWIRARITAFNALTTAPLGAQAWLIPDPFTVSRCPVEKGGCGTIFVDAPGGTLPRFPHPDSYDPGYAVNANENQDCWCPVCGSVGLQVPVERLEPGGNVSAQLASPMLVPEGGTTAATRWSSTLPTVRPRIPDEAVQIGPLNKPIPPDSSFPFWVSIAVPNGQRSSQPGDGMGNDISAGAASTNWGYRGEAVLYNAQGIHGAAPDSPDEYDDNNQWDQFYVCPDCGTRQAAPAGVGPSTGWACVNPACPGHRFCNYCAQVLPAADTVCPFCGGATTLVKGGQPAPNDANVTHSNLAAESYDVFDLQLSVLKQAALVAERGDTDLGKVAPGVPLKNPDNGAALPDTDPRAADPANVSHWGETVLRNDGNTIPDVITLPLSDRMFRPEADQGRGHGYGWASARNPISSALTRAFYDDVPYTGGAPGTPNYLALSADPANPWRPLTPDPRGAAGPSAGSAIRVGAGTAAENGGVAPGTGDVVGTGQVLGRYSGRQLYFMDCNTGPAATGPHPNGVLDFLHWDGSNWIATTSALMPYDPLRDEAIEPVVEANSRLRVSESRLPYNSYLLRDTAPSLWFQYVNDSTNRTSEPSGVQIIWMTAAGGNAPAAAATLNYADGTASGAGVNRTYTWSSAAPATLDGASGTLSSAGPADVYADNTGPNGSAGNHFAVWSATDRAGGGLRAEIRQSRALAGTSNWAAVVSAGTYDRIASISDRAEGVRGMYDPDYGSASPQPLHWTFWHTGARGAERAMFAAWYRDPGTGKMIVRAGGPLPLDNSILPADRGTTVDAYYDPDGLGPLPALNYDADGSGPGTAPTGPVTFQKFPQGPFLAVKDLSPILYLPPTVYTPNSGDPDATQPILRVFFAGYARHLRNFDIYEARFKRKDLLNGTNNWGKLPFNTPEQDATNDDSDWPQGLPSLNPTEEEAGLPGAPPGEQFTADAMRREFYSKHLDWVTRPGYLNGSGGASFVLGVKLYGVQRTVHYYDVIWSGQLARGEYYDAKRGVYVVIPRLRRHNNDPQYDELPGWPNGPAAPPPGSPAGPEATIGSVMYYPDATNGNAYELIEPSTFGLASSEKRPLRMEIDPVLGRVRFSAPLFNTGNPDDRSCVFNTGFSQLANKIEDVFLVGRYEAYLRRLTTSPADDDLPTAILQSGPWNGNIPAPATQSRPWGLNSHNNTLLLFWRRTFGPGQAPYYGRTCTMMKVWTWNVRVNYPPIAGAKTDVIVRLPAGNYTDPNVWPHGPYPYDPSTGECRLQGPGMPTETVYMPVSNSYQDDFDALPTIDGTQPLPEYDVDMANGTIAIWPGVFRWYEYNNTSSGAKTHAKHYLGQGSTIWVTYTDMNGVVHQNEPHQIGGWSQETVIPIDTVLSEGPFRAAEETYSVPWSPSAAAGDPRLVAWRYWMSWASPRPVFDIRTQQMRQSSDVYFCTVAPEFPALFGQATASSYAHKDFRR